MLKHTERNLWLKLCLVSAYTLLTSNQFTGHLEIWEQAENMLCTLPCWETLPLSSENGRQALHEGHNSLWSHYRISLNCQLPAAGDFIFQHFQSSLTSLLNLLLAGSSSILPTDILQILKKRGDFKGRFSLSNHPLLIHFLQLIVYTSKFTYFSPTQLFRCGIHQVLRTVWSVYQLFSSMSRDSYQFKDST